MACAEPAAAVAAEVADSVTVARQITVTVVYAAAPHQIDTVALQLPEGATVADALRASGPGLRLGAQTLDSLTLGLWGRACAPATLLRDGDRLALLRPLLVDPKEARRLRYRRDGLRKRPTAAV